MMKNMENAYLIPVTWDELSLNNGLFNVRFKCGIKFNFKTQGNKMFEDQRVITSVFLKACRNAIFSLKLALSFVLYL